MRDELPACQHPPAAVNRRPSPTVSNRPAPACERQMSVAALDHSWMGPQVQRCCCLRYAKNEAGSCGGGRGVEAGAGGSAQRSAVGRWRRAGPAWLHPGAPQFSTRTAPLLQPSAQHPRTSLRQVTSSRKMAFQPCSAAAGTRGGEGSARTSSKKQGPGAGQHPHPAAPTPLSTRLDVGAQAEVHVLHRGARVPAARVLDARQAPHACSRARAGARREGGARASGRQPTARLQRSTARWKPGSTTDGCHACPAPPASH